MGAKCRAFPSNPTPPPPAVASATNLFLLTHLFLLYGLKKEERTRAKEEVWGRVEWWARGSLTLSYIVSYTPSALSK